MGASLLDADNFEASTQATAPPTEETTTPTGECTCEERTNNPGGGRQGGEEAACSTPSRSSFVPWRDGYYEQHLEDVLNVTVAYVGKSKKRPQVDTWCTTSSSEDTPPQQRRQLGPLTFDAEVGLFGDQVEVLLDSGASRTFGNEELFKTIAKKNNLPVQRLSSPLQVRVASGNIITAQYVMRHVPVRIGETYHCTVDVTLLPLGKLQLVLGMPWLEQVNPGVCWRTRCLTVQDSKGTHLFCASGRDVRLLTDANIILPEELASLDEAATAMERGEVCYLMSVVPKSARTLQTPDAVIPVDEEHEARVYIIEQDPEGPSRQGDLQADLHKLEALTQQAEAALSNSPRQKWLHDFLAARAEAIKSRSAGEASLTAMDDQSRREPVTANDEGVPEAAEESPLQQFDRLFKAGIDDKQYMPEGVFQQLREIISRSEKVFTAHDSLPEGQNFEGQPFRAVFRLRKDAPPPEYRRARSVSPRELEFLRTKLGLWMKRGFIRPCISETTSPVVLVKKPGHTAENPKLRLCANFCGVNRRLEIVRFSPPKPRDLFNELRGYEYFTVADMSDGFHSVRLAKESQQFTAMEVSGLGTFCWQVLPMGTASSPGIFSWVVTQALRTVLFPGLLEHRDRRAPAGEIPVVGDKEIAWALQRGVVRAYVDDVIIASRCIKSHFIILKEVLRLLELQGLRVSIDKLKPLRTRVVYLGYIISKEGIAPDPAKQQVIRDWPLPSTKAQLHSFLGLSGYYRDLSPNFAHWSSILYPHVSVDAPDEVTWSPDMKRHFEQIKAELCSRILLSQPDPDREYIVMADASKYAIGAALMQEARDGTRVPVAFCGRKFTPTELRYFPYEREALALYYACTQWFNYLDGARSVLVETDHRSLADLLTQKKELDGRQARWAEFLARFPITLKWIKGVDNAAADAISRRPDWHPGEPPAFEFQPAEELAWVGEQGCQRRELRPQLATFDQARSDLAPQLLWYTDVLERDQWVTAPHVVRALSDEFGPFTATACGRADGADNVTGPGTETWPNADERDWGGHNALVNPPYSNIGPIVARFLQCKERRPEDTAAVFLLPMGPAHTRTEWFHEAITRMLLVKVYPKGADIFRLPRERFYGSTDDEYVNVGPCPWPVGVFVSPRGQFQVPEDQTVGFILAERAQHALLSAEVDGITVGTPVRDGEVIGDEVLSEAYEQYPLEAVTPLSDPQQTENILAQVLQAYETDAHAGHLLREGTAPYGEDPAPGAQWTVQDGLIYVTRPRQDFPVLYIPENAKGVQESLLEEFHDTRLGAHQGIRTTTLNLERHVWWPSLRADVQRYVTTCTTCARVKAVRAARAGGEQYTPELPGRPFEVVAIDSFDMPPAASGNNACWAFVCCLTRRAFLEPYTKKGDTGAKLASRYLWTIYRNGFGLPRIIVSDLDPKLISHFWRRLWTKIGTTLKFVPKAAHHQNGRAERFIGTIQDLLRATTRDGFLHWDEDCPVIEVAYNDTYRAGIPVTPFQQTIGYQPVTPAALVFEAARRRLKGADSQYPRDPSDARSWLRRFQDLVVQTKARLREQLVQRVRAERAGTAQPPVFDKGEYVWVQDMAAANSSRLSLPVMRDRYTGPYKILNRVNLNYDLDFGPSSRRANPIHVSQLKPYISRTTGLSYPDKGDHLGSRIIT